MPLFTCEIVNIEIPTLFSKHWSVPLHEVEVIKNAFRGLLLPDKEISITETGEFEEIDSDVEYKRLASAHHYPDLNGSPFVDAYGGGKIPFEDVLKRHHVDAKKKQEQIKLTRAACENTTLDYLVAKERRKAEKPWPMDKMGPKTVAALKEIGIENSADLGRVIGESTEKIGDIQRLARILAMPGASKEVVQLWRNVIFAD
jgi:hypothetical protein